MRRQYWRVSAMPHLHTLKILNLLAGNRATSSGLDCGVGCDLWKSAAETAPDTGSEWTH